MASFDVKHLAVADPAALFKAPAPPRPRRRAAAAVAGEPQPDEHAGAAPAPQAMTALYGHLAEPAAPPNLAVVLAMAQVDAALARALRPRISPGPDVTPEDRAAFESGQLGPAEKKELGCRVIAESLGEMTEGDGWDAHQVVAQLESIKDPDELQRVLDDYRKRTGRTLDGTFRDQYGKGNYYTQAAEQLASGDRIAAEKAVGSLGEEKRDELRAAARKIGAELHGAHPDRKLVFETLGFRKPEELEFLRQAYNECFPSYAGLFNDLNGKMSGDDEKEAIADLDMGADARLRAAGAALRNAFGGFGHANDRARMKAILDKLTPDEVHELDLYHSSYGVDDDIIDDVKETMHGVDHAIVANYVAGKKDAARGCQIAEDIVGNGEKFYQTANKLDEDALFAKLEKLRPGERASAVAAYDAQVKAEYVEQGKDPDDAPTLERLMRGRFTDNDDYRGQALLAGDTVTAKAEQFLAAVDRRGTRTDDAEASLSDPDLASDDPDKRRAAGIRRREILETIKDLSGRTAYDWIDDEDALEKGKDDRVALDDILATGSVSLGMQVRRAIDKGDRDQARSLLLGASKEEVAAARKLFKEHPEWGSSLDGAVRLEFGPDHYSKDGNVVRGDDADSTGAYVQMQAALEDPPASGWSPKKTAEIDARAHEADRASPDLAEMMGRSTLLFDASVANARETAAAEAHVPRDQFQIVKDDRDSAEGAYQKERQDDAESLVSSLKLVTTALVAVFAPAALPLVSAGTSLGGVLLKEHELGKAYAGEQDDWKGAAVDGDVAALGALGDLALAGRAAGAARKLEEVDKAGQELITAGQDAKAVGEDVKAAEAGVKHASRGLEGAAADTDAAAHAKAASAQLTAETEEAKKALEEKFKRYGRYFEHVKSIGDVVAHGAVNGDSFGDVVTAVVMGQIGDKAASVAADEADKILATVRGARGAEHAVATEVEGGAHAAPIPHAPAHAHPPEPEPAPAPGAAGPHDDKVRRIVRGVAGAVAATPYKAMGSRASNPTSILALFAGAAIEGTAAELPEVEPDEDAKLIEQIAEALGAEDLEDPIAGHPHH